jgi:hypothetical protein
MSENAKINVAWISGSFFSSFNILQKIKTKYSHAEIYNYDQDSSFFAIYNNLITVSCFSACKLIVISDLPDMTDGEKKKMKEAIENLPPEILVVFYGVSKTSHKILYSAVEKIGKIYESVDEIATSQAGAWIMQRCKELNIDIFDDALQSLVQNSPTSQSGKFISCDIIETTLQKLMLYNPSKKPYDTDDIIATSAFSESFVIWNILNACDAKNFDLCINYFEQAVHFNGNPINALNEVINILCWKFRMLLSLKEHMANGNSQQQSIEKTSQLRKFSYIGQGMNAKPKVSEVQTGANKGSAACLWSSYVCGQATNSISGRKPQIELYTRKELYVITRILEESLVMARLCQMKSEAYLIADIIFASICNNLDASSVDSLKKAIINMRTDYARY